MAIPVSTVPAAVAALTSQIQIQINANESAPGAVLLIYGEEGMDAPADLIIVATNVNRNVRHEAFLGSLQTGSLEESYTIDILCSAYSGDPDPVANMNRSYTLVGYVETAVRTDPTLGGNVLIARPLGSRGGQSFLTESPTGRQTDVIVSIFVDTLN